MTGVLSSDPMPLLSVQEERQAGVRLYRPHTQKAKTVVFDWDAITPTCTTCGAKSGQLSGGECPACRQPASVAAPTTPIQTAATTRPAKARAPKTPRPPAPRSPGRRTGRSEKYDATQIAADYRSGQTAPQIAAALGTTPQLIRRYLQRHGVELRDDRARRSGGGNRIPADLRGEAVRLYGTGLSQAEVGRMLGVSDMTVGRVLRAAGVVGRRTGYAGGDTLGRVRDRLNDLGVTATQVRSWAHETGIPCGSRGVPSTDLLDAYEIAHPTKGTPT